MISNTSTATPPPAPREADGQRRLESGEILKGNRQVLILHEGQEYRLQVTKNGKLILTK